MARFSEFVNLLAKCISIKIKCHLLHCKLPVITSATTPTDRSTAIAPAGARLGLSDSTASTDRPQLEKTTSVPTSVVTPAPPTGPRRKTEPAYAFPSVLNERESLEKHAEYVQIEIPLVWLRLAFV